MSDITVHEAETRRTTDQVLDVREDYEVSEGIVPGAIHIPLGELGTRLSELEKSRPVIVICRSGNRSSRATEALIAAGFTAENMTGGMIAWARAGLPLAATTSIPRGQRP